MRVNDLIIKLKRCNPEAEIHVVVDNCQMEFSLAWGGAEGAKQENCESVAIYVEGLNQSEVEG